MTVHRRLGVRAFLASIAIALTAGALVAACAETRRALGDECLKDDDCVSLICRSAVCSSVPPNAGPIEPNNDAAAPPVDAPAETGPDVAETGATETGGGG